jgi:hypothetical protein
VKRTPKKTTRAIASRNPKLPDELQPIVDSVVEVVFERLREAAQSKAPKAAPAKRKTTKLNLPLPKQRTAFAEALADLLLADLAGRVHATRSAKGREAKRGKAKPATTRKAVRATASVRPAAKPARRGGARPISKKR